ncbi:hypothetical protein L3Y34_014379 [Caenorhabditis briggsae]|uniref:Uncharacterized protein n=1 Tax=Caenorhabditis briggsae TaxID=6238 RepID=A0AAE9IY62_CAEBR|nr:hypothetical protein L3Y34_014379 [Caenorhabditis briggsae]
MSEAQRHIDDPKVDRKPVFLRTLHGPRNGIDDFRKKEKNAENANITEHFPIVKVPVILRFSFLKAFLRGLLPQIAKADCR